MPDRATRPAPVRYHATGELDRALARLRVALAKGSVHPAHLLGEVHSLTRAMTTVETTAPADLADRQDRIGEVRRQLAAAWRHEAADDLRLVRRAALGPEPTLTSVGERVAVELVARTPELRGSSDDTAVTLVAAAATIVHPGDLAARGVHVTRPQQLLDTFDEILTRLLAPAPAPQVVLVDTRELTLATRLRLDMFTDPVGDGHPTGETELVTSPASLLRLADVSCPPLDRLLRACPTLPADHPVLAGPLPPGAVELTGALWHTAPDRPLAELLADARRLTS